jgi:predicted KAP-like P-loop ATPase
VVVLIDELDRVEDEEVRAVARLVKAVGDIRGISHLVAYDPKRVVDALGRGVGEERSRSGEAYLEKLVQLVVPMRPLLDYEILALLRRTLEAQGHVVLSNDDDALPSEARPRSRCDIFSEQPEPF